MSQHKGRIAEDLARDYLLQQGLRLRARNYRSRMGEIDLIMEDQQHLVFIEVRARRLDSFGDALESVTKAKQQKIMRTAAYYLQYHALSDRVPCRFDVVAVQGCPPTIHWVPNAFGLH